MQNTWVHGDSIPYANATGAAIKGGDIVPIGDLIGVAISDILDTSSGIVQLAGVFTLPKTTGQAWSQGAKVYFDATTKLITTTIGSNVQAGWVYAAALSGDATGLVKLKIS